MSLLTRLFRDPNAREVGRYQDFTSAVTVFEKELEQKIDDELRQSSLQLKEALSTAADKVIAATETIEDRSERNNQRKRQLDAILEPKKAYAFALVREAAKRTIGLRHYDVQIIGGAVLHRGQIAEMKTGEGKTLVACLPLYLNSLTGLGAHLVTVNDYLARRDAGWMGPVYSLLGLTVGVIGPQFSYLYDPQAALDESDERLRHFREATRDEAYGADITYGTNNEFGFDFLRDNMAQGKDQLVQRNLAYAIVDEVDSILIDEARTPLIISAPSTESVELYQQFADLAPKLKANDDFKVDEKAHAVSLTESGIKKAEGLLAVPNLYSPDHVGLVHHLDTALKAYALYRKNKEYVVKNNEVVIVDEFTGRLLHGRRYSGGLHQAIEAKEGVPINEESATLATITFQNYFRLYTKLAGMTGTAVTEAEEFAKIYGLEAVAVPPNRPNQRIDRQDIVYKTEAAKFKAVVGLVEQLRKTGQPALIGTVSIANSEKLSRLLKAAGIDHSVLNAKQHQREGEIIAQAGRLGAVTVATNMAGRGVDIILGGTPPSPSAPKSAWQQWEAAHAKVLGLGGLFVIGTERHESRRIDNQLRGRAGRQGDPGVSQFFLSLEDDLMRIFGGERMKAIMERLKMPEEMSINNPILTKAIEQAQSKVETHYFEIRKQLVEYDDVMNRHREAIYRRRQRVLMAAGEAEAAGVHQELLSLMNEEQRQNYTAKVEKWSVAARAQVERLVFLRSIDLLWVEHLKTMEALRESIGLRGYGQREPIVEYKREAYELFQRLQERISTQIVDLLLRAQLVDQAEGGKVSQLQTNREESPAPPSNEKKKIGRNDPCPCGAIDPKTGKVYKYKKCGLISAPHHRA